MKIKAGQRYEYKTSTYFDLIEVISINFNNTDIYYKVKYICCSIYPKLAGVESSIRLNDTDFFNRTYLIRQDKPNET